MALQQDPFADAWAMVEAEKELQERLSDWFTGVKQKKHCNGNDGNGCSMNIFLHCENRRRCSKRRRSKKCQTARKMMQKLNFSAKSLAIWHGSMSL